MARRTKEENEILKMCREGLLDGLVGKDLITDGGSRVWSQIKEGIPRRYKQGPGGKYFNNKENIRFDGVLHVLEEWSSDDEKLKFFQDFGWLMDNPIVKKYSAKFKPKK